MNNKFVKLTALLTTLALFLAGCSGSGPTAAASPFTAENDIFSYVPVDTEKRIVTIGKYDSFDEAPLEAVLEAKFPEVDVVFVETLAGPDPFAYMALQDQQGELPDIQVCKVEAEDCDFLYDLSAESSLSRYNLTSLNTIRTYEELGSNQELMTSAIQESGEIRPFTEGRLVLDWDIVGQ